MLEQFFLGFINRRILDSVLNPNRTLRRVLIPKGTLSWVLKPWRTLSSVLISSWALYPSRWWSAVLINRHDRISLNVDHCCRLLCLWHHDNDGSLSIILDLTMHLTPIAPGAKTGNEQVFAEGTLYSMSVPNGSPKRQSSRGDEQRNPTGCKCSRTQYIT